MSRVSASERRDIRISSKGGVDLCISMLEFCTAEDDVDNLDGLYLIPLVMVVSVHSREHHSTVRYPQRTSATAAFTVDTWSLCGSESVKPFLKFSTRFGNVRRSDYVRCVRVCRNLYHSLTHKYRYILTSVVSRELANVPLRS